MNVDKKRKDEKKKMLKTFLFVLRKFEGIILMTQR